MSRSGESTREEALEDVARIQIVLSLYMEREKIAAVGFERHLPDQECATEVGGFPIVREGA